MDRSFGEPKGLKTRQNLEKPAGEPDGVIIPAQAAFQSRFAGRGAPAMILSIDYVLFHAFPSDQEAIEEQGMVSSVEEALRLGADAIKVLMIFGRRDPSMQARNFDMIGRVAEQCHSWGMPVIVEPTTWGHRFKGEQSKDVSILRDMARIAFEFGADVVKIDTCQDPASFQSIVDSCPVPILVLGGARKPDAASLLKDVLEIMNQGAAGVTFGRNVWQHPDPERIVRALKKVVHEKDIESALQLLEAERV
jgi:class I fructose-bisphosphate aldolase